MDLKFLQKSQLIFWCKKPSVLFTRKIGCEQTLLALLKHFIHPARPSNIIYTVFEIKIDRIRENKVSTLLRLHYVYRESSQMIPRRRNRSMRAEKGRGSLADSLVGKPVRGQCIYHVSVCVSGADLLIARRRKGIGLPFALSPRRFSPACLSRQCNCNSMYAFAFVASCGFRTRIS